jgi:hypothetical protein
MVALSQHAIAAENTGPDRLEEEQAYRVFWRLRSSGAWRREEFESRDKAFERYFHLMRKGLELRWGRV